jgi:AcrR family transcriptional regulator
MSEEETKQELGEALRKALQSKPLNKVTVTELASACNMNRQSFYYHFKDVYYLSEYLYKHDISKIMAMTPEAGWQEMIGNIFQYAIMNKTMILNTINSVNRDILEYNIYEEIGIMLIAIIKEREKALNIAITPEDEKTIADFYKYPIVGAAFDWFKTGMVYDPSKQIGNVMGIVNSNLDSNIKMMKSKEDAVSKEKK